MKKLFHFDADIDDYRIASKNAIGILEKGCHKKKSKKVTLIHHTDCDGICAGLILETALKRVGYKVKLLGVEKIYAQIIELIYLKVDTPIIFTDLGGGAASEIAEIKTRLKNKNLTIVVDHHHTKVTKEQKKANIINLSSEVFGISGEEDTSGASIALVFSNVLAGDDSNMDLSYIAVLGSLGDKHDRTYGKLIGLNRDFLLIAEQQGDIEITKSEGVNGGEDYWFDWGKSKLNARFFSYEITMLGSVGLHGGGIDIGFKIISEKSTRGKDYALLKKFSKKKKKLYKSLICDWKKNQRKNISKHIQWVNSDDYFGDMGLKLVGSFLVGCEVQDDNSFLDSNKYLIGFQPVQNKVFNLGEIKDKLVKISGRLPKVLEKKIYSKNLMEKMPGYVVLFFEVAKRMGVSIDAIHDNMAALVVKEGQRREFLDILECVIEEKKKLFRDKSNKKNNMKAFVIGDKSFVNKVKKKGIKVIKNNKKADFLIIDSEFEINVNIVNDCIDTLMNGVKWVVVGDNLDKEINNGGFLVGALNYCTGKEPDIYIKDISDKWVTKNEKSKKDPFSCLKLFSKHSATRPSKKSMKDFKGFIFDMDGVIFRENEVIDGTKEMLQKLEKMGKKVVFLTNHSAYSKKDLQKKVTYLKLPIKTKNMIPTTYATARYIKLHNSKARVHVVGAPGLVDELILSKLNVTDDIENIDYLVTGSDTNVNFERLNKGINVLSNKKVKWVVASADRLHPTPKKIQAGGGFTIGALNFYSKRLPDVYGCKPSADVMKIALNELGLKANEVLMVGDTLASDIQGGINAGIPTALVMSGATTPQILKKSKIKPDFVFGSIKDIFI